MGGALADANLCIRGYPTHKCLLPGEAHHKNSKNKGIGALTQKEISALAEALRAGTMHVTRVDKAHRGKYQLYYVNNFILMLHVATVIASERPVITSEAPPSEWPHSGGRQLFADGRTDYNGAAPLKPSAAATKVKK
ncbi:hypothetical protein F4604DRAFT_1539616, partial [Suillus subluteus]